MNTRQLAAFLFVCISLPPLWPPNRAEVKLEDDGRLDEKSRKARISFSRCRSRPACPFTNEALQSNTGQPTRRLRIGVTAKWRTKEVHYWYKTNQIAQVLSRVVLQNKHSGVLRYQAKILVGNKRFFPRLTLLMTSSPVFHARSAVVPPLFLPALRRRHRSAKLPSWKGRTFHSPFVVVVNKNN